MGDFILFLDHHNPENGTGSTAVFYGCVVPLTCRSPGERKQTPPRPRAAGAVIHRSRLRAARSQTALLRRPPESRDHYKSRIPRRDGDLDLDTAARFDLHRGGGPFHHPLARLVLPTKPSLTRRDMINSKFTCGLEDGLCDRLRRLEKKAEMV